MHRFVSFIPTSIVLLLAWTFSASALAEALSPDRERALKQKDSFKECEICPEMVVVPAGSFTMGSPKSEKNRHKALDKNESPQHVVSIGRPFAVGKFEITVDQFAAFVKETGHDTGSKCGTYEDGKVELRGNRSWRNPGFLQNGSHPAACLNWDDSKAYVAWLSRITGKGYRLLTEAEWEYAARGRTRPGSAPRFHFGGDESAMCGYGNGADQTAKKTIPGTGLWKFFSCSDGYAYTAPVGSFSANAFGLHDMLGNVLEWTEDCYNDNYRGAPVDGSAWTSGDCSSHVLRGGAWYLGPRGLRVALRGWHPADNRGDHQGIRVARTLTAP